MPADKRFLSGKGMYIWQILECEAGNPSEIVKQALAAGISHVFVKIADGIYAYGLNRLIDLPAVVVKALQQAGITVWGWHYVYGNDPIREAEMAGRHIKETGVTGYVVDAESEYKLPGKAAAARVFMARLRADLPDFPVGLSSYRYPSLHPQFPWVEFLSRCDVNIPQVYWMFAANPGEQLRRSVAEFAELPVRRPLIPTGAAWKQGSWKVTPAQVVEFMDTAKALGLPGASFWSWQHARADLPAVWEAVAAYPFRPEPQPGPVPVPQPGDPDPGQPQRVRVTTSKLNVRSAPVVTAETARFMAVYGQTFDVEREQDGWVQIKTWVSRDFVEPA